MTWYVIKDDRASSDREYMTVAQYETEQEARDYIANKYFEHLKHMKSVWYLKGKHRRNAKRSLGQYFISDYPVGINQIDYSPCNT